MIIRAHELYQYVVKAFDNKKWQECLAKDIKLRIFDTGVFVCSDWDNKLNNVTLVSEIKSTFEELAQEIRVMIFKRQLYLKHMRNNKNQVISMEKLSFNEKSIVNGIILIEW